MVPGRWNPIPAILWLGEGPSNKSDKQSTIQVELPYSFDYSVGDLHMCV